MRRFDLAPKKDLFQNFEPRQMGTRIAISTGPKIPHLKILLVEGSPDIQTIVAIFLRNTGAMVELANNGKEGFEKNLAGDYDIVLMDLQMPKMDGR